MRIKRNHGFLNMGAYYGVAKKQAGKLTLVFAIISADRAIFIIACWRLRVR